jgi:antitoxin CcdA
LDRFIKLNKNSVRVYEACAIMMCMKARANVSIDKELLDQIKEMNLSLSSMVEQALRVRLAEEKEKLWKEKNKSAIDAYNRHVEGTGLFSDGMRTF